MNAETNTESYLIEGGRVLDPATQLDAICDVHVEHGRIRAIAPGLSHQQLGCQSIAAKGCWVVPGGIDLRASASEPGSTSVESIASGLRAATAGGYCAMTMLPNTEPVHDNAVVTSYVLA